MIAKDLQRTTSRSFLFRTLSVGLIISSFVVIFLCFRTGVEQRQDVTIVVRGANFFQALCAVISMKTAQTGRYVCASNVHQALERMGLGFEAETLKRLGKTLPELGNDSGLLNRGLQLAFSSIPLAPASGIIPIGWAQDAGYMDFVDFAFHVFGRNVPALYYAFFLLLGCSIALACLQFRKSHFALLLILSYCYILYFFDNNMEGYEIYSVTNPRFLSILAIVPLLHATFLILFRVRLRLGAALLMAAQGALMAAAADFRATAYWAIIALCLVGAAAIFGIWGTGGQSLRDRAVQCWPAFIAVSCVAIMAVSTALLTDSRLAQIGGMRTHALWQPMLYELQNHPQWKIKYLKEFDNLSGDDVGWVAMAHYLRDHPYVVSAKDYVLGNKQLGLTQLAEEKVMRAAYIDFVKKDPWYLFQLKYFDLVTVLDVSKSFAIRAWEWLRWPYLLLLGGIAASLGFDRQTNWSTFRSMAQSALVVAAFAVLAALPTWITAVTIYALVDVAIVATLASYAVALVILIGAGLLLSELARLFRRKHVVLQSADR